MSKVMYALIALLISAVLANAVLAYLWIDRSISLSYARQGAESANYTIRQLERLLEEEWRGLPEAQVLQKLQKATAQMPNAKTVIKKEDSFIWFDEVRFTLEKGQLSRIGDR